MKNARKDRKEYDPDLEVLDDIEAAALLRVCDKTLRKLRQQTNIPHARVGKRIVYLRSALIQWVAAGGTTKK